MSGRLSVTGISELVLEVYDLDAARRFYRDVLGFEETLYGEGAEGRYWYLVGETARLGLWTEQVGLAGGGGGAPPPHPLHPSRGGGGRPPAGVGGGGGGGGGPRPPPARPAALAPPPPPPAPP